MLTVINTKFFNKFGKDHAPSTVRKFNGVIRQCVKNAIIDGLINKDFTAGIKLGENDDKTLHVEYLNVAEIVKLIQYLKNGRQARYTSRYMCIDCNLHWNASGRNYGAYME